MDEEFRVIMRLFAITSALRAAVAAAMTVVFCAGTTAAQAPPLGEVARKEAERRKDQPAAGKVYTNKDLPASAQDRLPTASPYAEPSAEPGQAAPGAATPAAPATAAAKGDAAKQPVRDEAWWKARIVKAREDLRREEMLAESLQSRINALSRDFVSRDNPVQRAQLGEQRTEALEELAGVRAAIERGRQEIEAIEEEARRAGVPPGWLR